ncbi:MAG: hypothetical protein IJX62_06385 [Clostridia bacterium]|nr:hypothetical protein [Clostridia bacterium]
MKKTICILLLCLLTLTTISCANSGFKTYYSKEIDGITYSIRGKSEARLQLYITQGEKVLLSEKLTRSKNLGDPAEDFGLQVLDLNFDGALDVMLPTGKDGDCVSYSCFLKNATGDGYTYSAELSALCNLRTDEDLLAVFGFSHTFLREEYPDSPDYTVSTDTTTKYVWREGKLQPQIRVSLSYYSQTDLYCYSVSYYDTVAEEFNDPDDRWLTPEEYRDVDFEFLYYFK